MTIVDEMNPLDEAPERWKAWGEDGWKPKLGPYWISQSGGAPFEAFLMQREVGDLANLSLRTTKGHLLRADDPRYRWHPWQETCPDVPEEAVDPGPGVWTRRPWRGGPHRVRLRDEQALQDVLVGRTSDDQRWREWKILFYDGSIAYVGDRSSRGRVIELWCAYPDPPAPPITKPGAI